jgi:DNA anti-recombination protein RmuC
MEKMGRGLNTAVNSYSKARSSYERRLIPKGREIEKLAVLNQEAQHLKPPIEVNPATLGIETSESELDS